MYLQVCLPESNVNLTIKMLSYVNPLKTPIGNPSPTFLPLMRSGIAILNKISLLLFKTCLVHTMSYFFLAFNDNTMFMICVDASPSAFNTGHKLDLKFLK